MDKIKGFVDNKLNQKSQPGNQVEAKADNATNQGLNQATDAVGVPDQYDNTIDQVADSKVNSDIPFGNN